MKQKIKEIKVWSYVEGEICTNRLTKIYVYFFSYYMFFDNFCFYIQPDLGNKHQTCNLSMKKATGITKKDNIYREINGLIQDMSQGQTSEAEIQNKVFNQTPTLIPRHIIR